jgi:hypothetical protein
MIPSEQASDAYMRRMYVLVLLCEAATIGALWALMRIYA